MNDPNHSTDDDAFEQRARALLQDSAQALNGRLRSRLTQARHAALAAMPANPRASNAWRRWIPAGAVAGAALMALLLVNQPMVKQGGGLAQTGAQPAATLVASNDFDDLDILADNDAVNMSDDSDFYEWAAAEAEGT